MPLVSVIIPNYNHAAFLKQRIESVLEQTYTEKEIILLDDCSTDDSQNIIEAYRSQAIVSHIVYNKTNSGSTFKQWEKGISLAKGNYIWIAESDDFCEPIFLDNVMQGLINDNSCVIGFTQSFVIDDKDTILWQSNYDKLQAVLKGDLFIQQHMLFGNGIYNASMAVFKKETYNNISKTFTSFRFCGDWLFWIEMAKTGNVFISAKHLNFFRKHKKDVSGKAYETGYNFFEELRLLDILKEELPLTANEYSALLEHKHFAFEKVKNNLPATERKKINQHFTERNYVATAGKEGSAFTLKSRLKKLLS